MNFSISTICESSCPFKCQSEQTNLMLTHLTPKQLSDPKPWVLHIKQQQSNVPTKPNKLANTLQNTISANVLWQDRLNSAYLQVHKNTLSVFLQSQLWLQRSKKTLIFNTLLWRVLTNVPFCQCILCIAWHELTSTTHARTHTAPGAHDSHFYNSVQQ